MEGKDDVKQVVLHFHFVDKAVATTVVPMFLEHLIERLIHSKRDLDNLRNLYGLVERPEIQRYEILQRSARTASARAQRCHLPNRLGLPTGTCDVGHIDGGGKNNNFDLTLVTLWHHYVIMAYGTVDKRWPMG